jgi:hypothetical protein
MVGGPWSPPPAAEGCRSGARHHHMPPQVPVPQEWPPPLACKDGTHQWLSVCLYIYIYHSIFHVNLLIQQVRSLNARLDKLIREAAARSARAGALPAAGGRGHKTIAREARKVIHDLDNIYEQLRNPAPELPELAGDGTMNLIDTVGVSCDTRANN